MISLYWAVSERAGENVRAKLEDMSRVAIDAGRANGIEIFAIEDPDPELIARTRPMIAAGLLRSGVLVVGRLEDEHLWVAGEWWGRFLVQEPLLELVNAPPDVALDRAEVAGRTFVIVPAETPEPAEPESPTPFPGQTLSRSTILADPALFYGDYADTSIGGANALFAAGHEAARVRGLPDEMIVLGGPEDFGFARDTSDESVSAWRRKRVIDAEAVGFGLGDWKAAFDLATRHGVAENLAALQPQAAEWRDKGFGYGVAAILIGLADPPVVIPMGAVYQQPVMGASIQNLATGQQVTKMVPAGAVVPIVLPAYCLNQTFSPPNGPVTPTSLVYTAAAGSQQSVWSGIQTRYGQRP